MIAWDQYLHAELKSYLADEYLMDLLAFVTYPQIHVWALVGPSYLPLDFETASLEGVRHLARSLPPPESSSRQYLTIQGTTIYKGYYFDHREPLFSTCA
jgi:hypothetical protein